MKNIGKNIFSLFSLFFLLLMLPILTFGIKKEASIHSKAAEEDDTAQTFREGGPKPEGIIIKYKENIKTDDDRRRVVRTKGIESEPKDLRFDNLVSVEVPEYDVDKLINNLKDDPDVEYVEPDFYLQYYDTPNDPRFPEQWWLKKISAPSAWDITKGSSSVNVAIIDSGVAIKHPDLSSKIIKRMNVQSDEPGHGTHVAGIAGAATNNGIGVASSGRNVGLYVADVGNNKGISLSSAISAIRWAADSGANVINMSWGTSYDSDAFRNVINYAFSKNVVLIAAAGNTFDTTKLPPAKYPNVFSVAATNSSDSLAKFSTRGSWVDIAAPGVSILSTVPDGYKSYSGSSMASPVVAGVAALVKSAFPSYSNQQIYNRLCSTADKVSGTGTKFRCGRVNAYKAVLGGGGTIPTSPPGTTPPTSPNPTPTVPPISDSNYQIKINFQGVNRKSVPQKIDYKVYSGSSFIYGGVTYSDSDNMGVYTVQIPKDKVSAGNYTVLIKGESFLQKKLENINLSSTIIDLSGKEENVPKAGDVTFDNKINISDVSRVSKYYTDFSIPVVYTDPSMPASDINKDGFITIQDLALLAINWSGLEVAGDN